MSSRAASLRELLRRHRGMLLFALFLLFLLPYLYLFRNALVDDAYIHLDYARSLLTSGTWGLRPGLPANSTTSPLNVLLLTAIGAAVGPTPVAVIVLAFICLAVTAFALDRLSRFLFQTPGFGWIATLALIFNPLLISTLGLESYLYAALLTLSIYCFLIERWIWLGFLLGLLTMTRPEGFLSAVVFLPFLPRGPARWRYIGALVATSAPWYLFSWIRLGSLIPDTFFIKLGMVPWGATSFPGGLIMYLQRFPLEAALSFLFLPLAAAILLKSVRAVPVLALIFTQGLAHFLAYSGLNARPFHWYYSQDVACAILFACLGLGRLLQLAQRGSWPWRVERAAAAAFVVVPFLGMMLLLSRVGFSPNQMPIHSNWATPAQYQQIASWLEANVAGQSVRANAEIGTVTYYCPDCYLLDLFSDRRWLITSAQNLRAQPGIAAAVYRLNFLFLRAVPDRPPDAFVLTSYDTRQQESKPAIMKWETSTRWSPEALMTLAAATPPP